jgi:hypothetical protein
VEGLVFEWMDVIRDVKRCACCDEVFLNCLFMSENDSFLLPQRVFFVVFLELFVPIELIFESLGASKLNFNETDFISLKSVVLKSAILLQST